MAEETDPLIGQTLGGYKILTELAAGGMGKIYRAQHTRLEKIVALKVLAESMMHVEEYVERFHREALNAAKLEHPNVVRIYDFGQEQEVFYLVMQFVEGESLADRIKRMGRLPVDKALHIVREIANGLDAAHKKSLVHRDIKPDNILISKEREEVMITDFGLVKNRKGKGPAKTGRMDFKPEDLAMEDGGLTVGGSILGTPYYMSPEQCEGLPDIDARADLYSLGLILYEMLTGKVPIEGSNAMIIMQNRLMKDPIAPYKLNPSIGPRINNLIMALLQRDRKKRIPTAEILINRLDAIIAADPRCATVAIPGKRPSSTGPRRRKPGPLPGAKRARKVPPGKRPAKAQPGKTPSGKSSGPRPPASQSGSQMGPPSGLHSGAKRPSGSRPPRPGSGPKSMPPRPPSSPSHPASSINTPPAPPAPAPTPAPTPAPSPAPAPKTPAPPPGPALPDKVTLDEEDLLFMDAASASLSEELLAQQPPPQATPSNLPTEPEPPATAAPITRYGDSNRGESSRVSEFYGSPASPTPQTPNAAPAPYAMPTSSRPDSSSNIPPSAALYGVSAPPPQLPAGSTPSMGSQYGAAVGSAVGSSLDDVDVSPNEQVSMAELDLRAFTAKSSGSSSAVISPGLPPSIDKALSTVTADKPESGSTGLKVLALVVVLLIAGLGLGLAVKAQNKGGAITIESISAIPEWTNKTSLTVHGKVSRGPISLKVAGKEIKTDDNGLFQHKVKLERGRNAFTLEFGYNSKNPKIEHFVIMLDDAKPSLVIDELEGDEMVVDDKERTIRGSVQDPNAREVTVNGQSVEFNAKGEFTYSLPEGEEHDLEVIATDRAGNATTKAFKVRALPQLKLLNWQQPPAWINKTSFTLKGQSSRKPLKITLNGETWTSEDGQIEKALSFQEGSNSYKLFFEADDGTTLKREFIVNLDTKSPEVSVEDELKEGQIYLKEDSKFRGRITEANLKELRLNDLVIDVGGDGRFAAKLNFKGKDSQAIEFIVRDHAGNEVKRSLEIFSPVHLAFLKEPELPKATTQRQITVSGQATRGPVTVSVGAISQQSSSSGQFAIRLTLANGKNEFRLKLRSADNTEIEKLLTIDCDTDPPVIEVTGEKLRGWIPLKPGGSVQGRVKDSNISELTAGAKAIALEKNGSFKIDVDLSQKDPQVLELKARDEVGNTSVRRVRVSSQKAFEAEAVNLILLDRELWDEATEELQDKCIEKVAKQLGRSYSFDRTIVYECGGLSHRIARFKHTKSGIEMHLIPGGRYLMGSETNADEQPVHQVILRPFLMGRYEVLQKEWDSLGGKDSRRFKGGGLPIENVTWSSIQIWLSKVGGRLRLPSESEWEYACRAGSTDTYFWGDELDDQYLWYLQNSDKNYSKTKKTFPNSEHDKQSNAFGLIDMLGNVKEWCRDDYFKDYRRGPRDNDHRGKGTSKYRVVRGGGWRSQLIYCRSASRKRYTPNHKFDDLGFRVARSLRWQGQIEFAKLDKNKSSGRFDPRALLADVGAWRKAGNRTQNATIKWAAKRLGSDYEHKETKLYDCNGVQNRIATFVHKKTGIELALIPGGQYQMGSNSGDEDEKPVHTVRLKPFLIGRYEVKQEQWDKSPGLDKRQFKGAALPIDSVSFINVKTWLKKLDRKLRLPTEAEWEYAARAGSSSDYYWGPRFDSSYCWFKGNADKNYDHVARTHPASEHDKKYNAFGLIDMLGNVKEWCQDDYFEDYRTGPIDNKARGNGSQRYRVIRGGSWYLTEKECRVSDRYYHLPTHVFKDVGFRVARSFD